MSYSQINDIDKIREIMLSIGKEKIISAFETEIGVHWSKAKMKNFYVCGLKHKGVLYYHDGKYPHGSLVIEFDKKIIK